MATVKDQLRALKNPRMLVVLLQGFASGLPVFLCGSTLQAWLTEAGIDIKTIGLLTLVGLPFTLKFLWSPVLDYFVLPLGRRKGWIFVSQILLCATLIFMSFCTPSKSILPISIAALFLSFVAATQDIALDAWRREYLKDFELGLGLSLNTTGYLVAMRLISGALALTLADRMPWSNVYQIMALCLVPSIICMLMTKEPVVDVLPPKGLKAAVIDPFKEFLTRKGAFFFLAFVLLYKLGDNMASAITVPFYLEMGYTKTEIGAASKLVGWMAIVVGGLLGGVLLLKLRLRTALWFFGIFQALSTACFVFLKLFPPSLLLLNSVIGFENLTAGVGTAAYATLIARLTNKKFTATQYALLTSLMGVPRVVMSAPTGYIKESLGWVGFFVFCAVIAIPGILMSLKIKENSAGEITI